MRILFVGKRTKTASSLLKAFESRGHTITEVDFSTVSFRNMEAFIAGRPIKVDYLLIRDMKEVPIDRLLLLAECVERAGGHVIDGVERIKRFVSSKAVSSAERDIDTFIPAGTELCPIPYPVIIKPVNGKYCRGVVVVNNDREYRAAISPNVVVQKYIPFNHENRVLVVNTDGTPRIVYMASKRNVARRGTKRKASYVPNREKLRKFVKNSDYIKSRLGIIGYDIGDSKHIIEANYSPRWDMAEQKLGLDISSVVVRCLEDF